MEKKFDIRIKFEEEGKATVRASSRIEALKILRESVGVKLEAVTNGDGRIEDLEVPEKAMMRISGIKKKEK